MSTVEKALNLLSFFTVAVPELGLSALARAADLDKATTLRLLTSMKSNGFIEQNPSSKDYRLGNAFLRFARIREASLPVLSVIQPVLDRLAASIGETAHGSLASGSSLITVGIAEPQRSTRVFVDPSQLLPYHATASGIAYLAFGPPDACLAVLKSKTLSRYTDQTGTSAASIRERVAQTARNGYAVSVETFEREVIGLAAPIFDWSGKAVGSVAIASVASRWTEDSEAFIAKEVVKAAVAVTGSMGADPPMAYMDIINGLGIATGSA
jgi:DNA-binding IclR family transcriptional regulator